MSQLNSVTRDFAMTFHGVSKSVAGIKGSLDGYASFKLLLKTRKKLLEGDILAVKQKMKTVSGVEYAVLQRIRKAYVNDLNRLNQTMKDLPKHRKGSEAAFERRHAELLALYDDAEKMGIDPVALVAEWKAERNKEKHAVAVDTE